MFVSPPIWLGWVSWAVCLFACLLVCLFVCLFVCLSVCLSFCRPVCLFECLFACAVCVCLCVVLFVLFVCCVCFLAVCLLCLDTCRLFLQLLPFSRSLAWVPHPCGFDPPPDVPFQYSFSGVVALSSEEYRCVRCPMSSLEKATNTRLLTKLPPPRSNTARPTAKTRALPRCSF